MTEPRLGSGLVMRDGPQPYSKAELDELRATAMVHALSQDRREGVTSRLEIITLAIELRNASIALAKLTCDTRIQNEVLADYLEAEVRPDYRALRKALKEHPEPQAAAEPGATAAVASARWKAAAAEEFASRMRDQHRSP